MKPVKPLAAFLVLFVLHQSLSEVGADLIAETCAKTTNPDLCATSLRSDPRGASAKDAKALTHIMYDLVLSNSKDTLAQVQKLLGGSPDPGLTSSLTICKSGYDSIVSDKIPNALKNLDSSSYVTATSLMSDAMFLAQICERTLSTGPAVPKSPLADENTKVINLCDIAMRLTASLG